MSASSSTGASSSAPSHRERALARLAREQRGGGQQHRHDRARLRQRAGEREERRQLHRRAECRLAPAARARERARPRSSSLWRDAVSPFPPGSAAAAPCPARARLRQRRHHRRRRQRSRPRGGVDAGRRAGRPRSTRATRRSAASQRKGIEAVKDARQTDRLDILPADQRRLRRVRRHAGGGAGTPDPQRGAGRRGDRPAPAHRRPPDRRPAQSDRDLPPGAGLEILSEARRVTPHQAPAAARRLGRSRSRASCGGRRSRERRPSPATLRRDHGARRRARALRASRR